MWCATGPASLPAHSRVTATGAHTHPGPWTEEHAPPSPLPAARPPAYGVALADPLSHCTDTPGIRVAIYMPARATRIHAHMAHTHTHRCHHTGATFSSVSLFHTDIHRQEYYNNTHSQTGLPGDTQTHVIPEMHSGGHRCTAPHTHTAVAVAEAFIHQLTDTRTSLASQPQAASGGALR